MINIGILDSGIDLNHSTLKETKITNSFLNGFEKFEDSLGHGTICANLISSIESNICLHNIKIFDKQLITTPLKIQNAIRWCIDNNIDIIHISASINDPDYFYEFNDLCQEAFDNNILIVAAADNHGRASLPAYLNSVIGVGSAKNIKEDEFYFVNDLPIKLYANGELKDIFKGNILFQPFGTSYAAARMTGIIAKFIVSNKKVKAKDVINFLQKSSLKQEPANIQANHQVFDFTSNAKNIIISNSTSLSINNLNKNLQLVSNNITNDLFSSYSNLTGFSITKKTIIGQNNNYPANDITLNDGESLITESFNDNIIKEISSRNGSYKDKIFVLDINGKYSDIIYNLDSTKKNKIEHPILTLDDILLKTKEIPEQHIFKNKKPIIACVNVSQNRFCFDVELKIRDILSENKLSSSHIGSNIFSEFFGCNFSLPPIYILEKLPFKSLIGYPKLLIESINNTENTDIILVGINHYNYKLPTEYSKFFDSSYHFNYLLLNSIQPDIVVFLINDFDFPNIIIPKIKNLLPSFRTSNKVILKNSFSKFNVDFSNNEILNIINKAKQRFDLEFKVQRSELEKEFGINVLEITEQNDLQEFTNYLNTNLKKTKVC